MRRFDQIKTSAGLITIRSVEGRDVPIHADYLFGSPRSFLEEIGFGPSKLPARDDWEQSVRRRVEAAAGTSEPPTVIAAELAGQVVSMVFLDRRHADGVPRRHFHIFDPDLRWQGLGQLILKAGIQVFAKEHGIKRFLIEPKADNKRMNRLMQKVGLKHVRDCVVSAGPATQEMSRSRRQSYCAVRCRQSS